MALVLWDPVFYHKKSFIFLKHFKGICFSPGNCMHSFPKFFRNNSMSCEIQWQIRNSLIILDVFGCSPVAEAQMCVAPGSLYPNPPPTAATLTAFQPAVSSRAKVSCHQRNDISACLWAGNWGMPVIPQLPRRCRLYLKSDLILQLVVICCLLETRVGTSQPRWLCSLPEWFSRSWWRGLQPWPWCFRLCVNILLLLSGSLRKFTNPRGK